MTTEIAAAHVAWTDRLKRFDEGGFDHTDPKVSDAECDAIWAEWDRIVQIPAAGTADILIKLAMIKHRYIDEDEGPTEVDHDAIVRDIKALAAPERA